MQDLKVWLFIGVGLMSVYLYITWKDHPACWPENEEDDSREE